MKPVIKLYLLLLLITHSSSYGQTKDYRYKRAIKGISTTWHRIILPDDLFGKTTRHLNDIRIYGITADRDTIEAPYMLKSSAPKAAKKSINFRIINASHGNGNHYFTFELSDELLVSQIKLDFSQLNFDWKVKLEGSHNQEEWYTLLEDYRILSIKNQSTDFQFTSLKFPASKYRYYRLTIPGRQEPELVKTSLEQQIIEDGILKTYSPTATHSTQDQQSKVTAIDVKLTMPLPISQIRLSVEEDFDYYRPVTIKYLVDSIETAQGWRYRYKTLTSGTLNSLSGNLFTFSSTTLQQLKIIIQNHDNQPLSVHRVEPAGFVYSLICRFTEEADYYLVYGNSHASSPKYDITQFTGNIPDSPEPLTLAAEEEIPREKTPVASPLFANKTWLWGVIVAIILLLGWFSLKMIKKA